MSFVNIYGGFERVVQTHGCALRKLYAWRGLTVQPLWRDLQNAVRKAAAAKAVEDAVVMKVASEVAALQAKKGEDAAAEDWEESHAEGDEPKSSDHDSAADPNGSESRQTLRHSQDAQTMFSIVQ